MFIDSIVFCFQNGRENIKILFPLSGKSLDLAYCYNQGHTVIGIEGVPLAVEEMFQSANLKYSRTFDTEIDGFIYKTEDERLTVYCCDFFKMNPAILGEKKCDAVFDRGAFVAIYESDREAYVKLILNLVTPNFRYILNSFDYEGKKTTPPRSCKKEKLFALFNGHTFDGSDLITNGL